ncbi:MAG: hypothetical protein V7L21_04300 [Nostoc sp.]
MSAEFQVPSEESKNCISNLLLFISATPVATTEGTSLRVHQSPTAGNPPTALDSPQRTGSSALSTQHSDQHSAF